MLQLLAECILCLDDNMFEMAKCIDTKLSSFKTEVI